MGKTMKFGCLTKKGTAEYLERPIPELGAHDVLIRNRACNICTSDYGQWLGQREHQGYPIVGGHEFSSVVEEIGAQVTKFAVGDCVGLNPYKQMSCGICEKCQRGQVSQCFAPKKLVTPDGYLGHFGFSTHAVADEKDLIHLSADLDPACAAFMEPLATVIKGQKKLRLAPLETVAVIGGGTMGLLNALCARARGARVIVLDLLPNKLELARSLGFDVVDSKHEDPVARVKELTGGVGVDSVIVVVGLTQANTQAIDMVKHIDGKVLLFAAAYPAPELKIDSNVIHYRRLELIGTYGADNEDIEDSGYMLSHKLIDVSSLVEPVRYPLSKIQEAYAAATIVGTYRVCVECEG